MGGRERIGKEKPYAEVSKSDGGEGSGSVKPHIGLKEATRVVKRGAGAGSRSRVSLFMSCVLTTFILHSNILSCFEIYHKRRCQASPPT